MRIFFVLLILAIAFGSDRAAAEVETKDLLGIYKVATPADRKEFETMLSTTENGFGWANAELKHRKMAPLYCGPAKIVLTGAQLEDILRRAAKDDPALNNKPWGLSLLLALERVFSCPPQSN